MSETDDLNHCLENLTPRAKHALILAGPFLDSDYGRSKLYDPAFETGYRKKRT